MKLLCLLFHNWHYTRDGKLRVCTRCGCEERKDVHCLGLNPPEYITTWIPVK